MSAGEQDTIIESCDGCFEENGLTTEREEYKSGA